MRPFLLAVVMAVTNASVALAQESLDELESSTAASATGASVGTSRASDEPMRRAKAEVSGYLAHRESYTQIRPSRASDTRDVPALTELFEANVQTRVLLGSPESFAYADLSMVYQRGGLYYVGDGRGGRTNYPNHDVTSLRPTFVPSELYLSLSPTPYLNLLAGKKRIIWGAGFAYNPTDLINPAKDPTDPNFQRAGNWLFRIEAPFRNFTLSVLAAPQALCNSSGLPYSMLYYPSTTPTTAPVARDQHAHYLLAGRLYALLADTDVNLIYYFSNYYQDAFAKKSRLGLSFARYFFTDYELHAEALLTRGSPRSFPQNSSLADRSECGQPCEFAPTKLDSKRIYPRVVLGTRRQFANEATASLEYYYQGDGYSPSEFRDAVNLMIHDQETSTNQVQVTNSPANATAASLPQRYSFNTLRRHYLIASYTQPHVRDDWTLGVVVVSGLEDLSGLVSPSVAWSSAEWLTLSLFGYVPFRGTGANRVKIAGSSYSEYSLMPLDFRVMFEARAFY